MITITLADFEAVSLAWGYRKVKGVSICMEQTDLARKLLRRGPMTLGKVLRSRLIPFQDKLWLFEEVLDLTNVSIRTKFYKDYDVFCWCKKEAEQLRILKAFQKKYEDQL